MADNGELKDLVRGEIKEEVAPLKEKLNAIYRSLVGTVDGETKGLVPRVENLEKANDKRTKIEIAGMLLLLSLVAKALWDIVVQ